MSKKKKPKPIPFAEVDVIRKEIDWHLTQASDLQASLAPHNTPRGFIAATNKQGDHVCIMFKGTFEDIFKVIDFIEGADNEK